MGGSYCLELMYTTIADSEPLWTMTPPLVESITRTPNRANLFTTRTNSFFSLFTWITVSKENVHKASTTT